MNWGQIQIESLKKMFLNSDDLVIEKLSDYKKDKKYKTYLFAMAQAANEAIMYILENVQPLIKKHILSKSDDNRFDLNTLVNFKRLYQVVNIDGYFSGYEIEGNNQLVIKDWKGGEIAIYYEATPDLLTSSTKDEKTIELPLHLVITLPLYIAGELYKEDDVQLSTIYMNEFLALIEGSKDRDNNPIPNTIQTIFSGGY